MQRLTDMSTSELIQTATQYSASIKEIGIYSELVKELTTRLGANTAAVTQALKERDEARLELSSAQLTISQITKVMGTSETLSISEQVAALNQQVVNLAVENAYLLGEIKQHSNSTHFCEKCGEADPCINDDVCWSLNHPTPATDAAIAQFRAEGINFSPSRLCAAYNNGFIDKPLKEVADVVGMILGAKEDITQAPAADGLSGEYAEKSLEAFAAELCKEASK